MNMEVFDPTHTAEQETIQYVPRPQQMEGLRIGLIDNTKFNSDTLLVKIARRLEEKFGMETVHMNRKKSSSHHVEASAVQEFKTKADFVIAGIGD